ncbi:hypothetical protein HQ545_04790 [Candidatus Woesearchaeota archaeon]|nr:hypothetical protein [Candidatus Woesearchaeota archaeon]
MNRNYLFITAGVVAGAAISYCAGAIHKDVMSPDFVISRTSDNYCQIEEYDSDGSTRAYACNEGSSLDIEEMLSPLNLSQAFSEEGIDHPSDIREIRIEVTRKNSLWHRIADYWISDD